MKKTLFIILLVLSTLLVFETGYLVGLREKANMRLGLAGYRKPYLPMARIQEKWDFFRKMPPPVKRGFATTMTSVDTEKSYTITMSLAGIPKEAINIEVRGNRMMISAFQKKESGLNKKGSCRQEFSSNSYLQLITLPENINVKGIIAEYNKGILMITIPKDVGTKENSQAVIKIKIK
ncbi:MAG: Hsp20/alpha crystallin family protein [Candidatus Omnitrophica bacterium]|nr:Hsp20/alpha crystallin family protein [Candidatus Omnitrophota bacterium]